MSHVHIEGVILTTKGGRGGLPSPYGAILGGGEGVPCPSGCLVSRWPYKMLRALTSLTSDRHVFATFCYFSGSDDHTYDFQNFSIISDIMSLFKSCEFSCELR